MNPRDIEYLSPEAVYDAFGGLSPNSPQWKAVLDILQNAVDEALEDCQRPSRSDADRHFDAGGAHMAVRLRNQFIEIMDHAQRRNQNPDKGS